MMTTHSRSRGTHLRARILNARTAEEVQSLLAEGEQYSKAAKGTRRKWSRAAEDRLRQLGSEVAK